jgi:hypothetical protein
MVFDGSSTISGQVTLHPSCRSAACALTCSIQRGVSGSSVATLTAEDVGTWFDLRGMTIISNLYSGVDGSQTSTTRVNMPHQLRACTDMYNECVVLAEQLLLWELNTAHHHMAAWEPVSVGMHALEWPQTWSHVAA